MTNALGSKGVVALGAAAVDMVLKVRNLPGPDEMAMVEDGPFSFPGGSTANVAVGLSRLGASVRSVGKVGDDADGRLIMDAFFRENIDTSFVRIESAGRTSRTIIAVDPKGARVIFSLGGTALLDTPEEFDAKMLEGAKLLYIGEARPDVGEAAAKAAKDMEIVVVYAPGGVFSRLGVSALEGILIAPERGMHSLRVSYGGCWTASALIIASRWAAHAEHWP